MLLEMTSKVPLDVGMDDWKASRGRRKNDFVVKVERRKT